MKIARTITISTAIADGPRTVLTDGKRRFRVTKLREELWPTSGGLRYAVRANGPILNKDGQDHASHEGGEGYFLDSSGALRAGWHADGDPFPAELAHLVHGRSALEALA